MPDSYLCSGAAGSPDTTVSLSGADLTVTTASDFGLLTNSGSALELTSSQSLTFVDSYNSTISGGYSGLVARNNGAGALSITSTGSITADSYRGIDARNAGTSLTISAVDVTGSALGIWADNNGSGALEITTTGTVLGGYNGITADNSNSGTNLVISAATVSGGGIRTEAITARNYGSGQLDITTTGAVTGSIEGTNRGTDFSISTAGVSSYYYGIRANNRGSGALEITSTDTIASSYGTGIGARNFGSATDLTISSAAVSGGERGYGMLVNNQGTGALDITATGAVSGGYGGIRAYNYGTDLTITTVAVTGGSDGINARNYGSGALDITATGTVSGTTDDGIDASTDGIDLTIVAVDVTGADNGIKAANNGTGELNITTTGTVTGTNVDGIVASNEIGSTDLTISAATVTGGVYGIAALNYGTGAIDITSTGTVTGGTGVGIDAYNYQYGTDLTISAAAVTGGAHGIHARNYGSGAIDITASGAVTGTDHYGIYANNSGTDLTISAAAVTGGNFGIYAANYGSGALDITATGAVDGGTNDGIYAISRGTDLTISAASVTGGNYGIYANNRGTGATDITASGAVDGGANDGIYALSHGTDLTISAAGVTGGNYGIDARNYGSGATDITASGAVTGGSYHGISAFTEGSDLTISAAAVTGGGDGIKAKNDGTGAIQITATGPVIGETNNGIDAYLQYGTNLTVVAVAVTGARNGIEVENYTENDGNTDVTATGDVIGTSETGIRAVGYGTDLTISAVNVTGAYYGIEARNGGIGALNITSSGDVVGAQRAGIYALNANNAATNLTISAVNVTGETRGIRASNFGSGELDITASGQVTSLTSDGIAADNRGTDLSISAAAVTGVSNGIFAFNDASGALDITSSGDVIGTAGNGIFVYNTGTDLTISTAAVTGGYHGIHASNAGSGDTSITTSGDVTGGAGFGIRSFGVAGASSEITLNSGSSVSATSGTAIVDLDADATVTVNSGAAVVGAIFLSNGSDSLTFAGGDFSGVTGFDGGDDSSTADGFVDTLNFAGSSGNLNGTTVASFETMTISGGSDITLTDNGLMIGDGSAGTGITIDADGSLRLANGSTTLSGLSNAGVLSLQNGAAGDTLTIAGDFTATSGSLLLDVALGDDSSLADIFQVTGDASGTTIISINNVGGLGAETLDGIEIVQVAGTDTGSYVLAGTSTNGAGEQIVSVGGFDYSLIIQADGNIALASVAGPIVPVVPTDGPAFDAIPSLLLSLNNLSDLRSRTTGRVTGTVDVSQNRLSFGESATPIANPLWFKISGSKSSIATVTSGSGVSDVDTDAYNIMAGMDVPIIATDSGTLTGGVNVFFGNASTTLITATDAIAIDTNSKGFGLTATWVDHSGFYVDGQIQYANMGSDIDDATTGSIASDVASTGVSASIEAGRSFDISPGMVLTPHAQLVYNKISTDSFVSPTSGAVAFDTMESTSARIGVSLDKAITTATGNGTIYGMFNIANEFDTDNVVSVGGFDLDHKIEDTSVVIGIGGTFQWDDRVEFSGSIDYATGLADLGNSQQVSGSIGVRIAF
jgi:outer membrane autotransporter protein